MAPAFPLPVRCQCEEPLWRAVLGTEELQNLGQRVLACMRCGTVEAVIHATEPIPGDPHDAVRVVGFERLSLEALERAWLGAWPRRIADPREHLRRPEDVFFLPASARFEDPVSLARAEAHAREHSSAHYDERLRAAGVPSEPPPECDRMRFTFWFFGESWRALAGNASDDELRAGADPLRAPASWCFAARLRR